MRRFLSLVLVSAVFFPFLAQAAQQAPCVAVGAKMEYLLELASDSGGHAAVHAFNKCLEQNAICVLTVEYKVVGARTLSDLPPGYSLFTFLQAVQLTRADERACLVASFSGGSAAAWMFGGWNTTSGKVVELKDFSRMELNSDAVDARSLLEMMVARYDKMGRRRSK